MDGRQSVRISRQSLCYLALCGAGVLAFALLALFPSHKTIVGLDGELAETRARIEDQKILHPVYTEMLHRLSATSPEGLKMPEKTDLSHDQVDQLSAIIGQLARETGLETLSVAPVLNSLTRDSRSISVVVLTRGDLQGFRGFYLRLKNLSFLDYVEEVLIQEATGGKEYRVKVWLRVNGAKSNVKA